MTTGGVQSATYLYLTLRLLNICLNHDDVTIRFRRFVSGCLMSALRVLVDVVGELGSLRGISLVTLGSNYIYK